MLETPEEETGHLGLARKARSRYLAEQDPDEIAAVLDLIESAPQRVLEIGTYRGGLTWLLARISTPDALILTVDDNSWGSWRMPISMMRCENQQVYCIIGNSHACNTHETVRTLLGEERLDLLVIDGDHTYQGVRTDWDLYSPLVRPGGMAILHDITDWAPAPRKHEVEVWKLWEELRAEFSTYEFQSGQTVGTGVVML